MNNAEIKKRLKEMLVKRLNLDVVPEEIDDGSPLFRPSDAVTPLANGLNLDSLEALEVVLGIERTFNLKIRSADYRKEFYSIQTLSNFVERLLIETGVAVGQP